MNREIKGAKCGSEKRVKSGFNNKKTEILSCVGLADIIEDGNKGEIIEYLERKISKYKGKIENVVLGCTHYPLIQEEIKTVLGKEIVFFNGAYDLAEHLKKILDKNNLLEINQGKVEFIDSQNSESKRERFYKLLKEVY